MAGISGFHCVKAGLLWSDGWYIEYLHRFVNTCEAYRIETTTDGPEGVGTMPEIMPRMAGTPLLRAFQRSYFLEAY